MNNGTLLEHSILASTAAYSTLDVVALCGDVRMTPPAGFFFGMFAGAVIGFCVIWLIEVTFETTEWMRRLRDKLRDEDKK